jgi:hypothetical protein
MIAKEHFFCKQRYKGKHVHFIDRELLLIIDPSCILLWGFVNMVFVILINCMYGCY